MTLTSPFLRKYGRYLFLFGTAAAIVAADRWTKKVAVRHLAVRTQGMAPPPCNERGPVQERVRYRAKPPVTVIPSFFDLRYSENCGGAWGLLGAANEKVRYPFFIGITILAIGFIVYLYRGLGREQRLLMAALPLVLGGAFGNFIDRLDSRYVVDFVDWYVRDWHWPTFNVADAGITVGIVLMVLDMIPRRKKAAAAEGRP